MKYDNSGLPYQTSNFYPQHSSEAGLCLDVY